MNDNSSEDPRKSFFDSVSGSTKTSFGKPNEKNSEFFDSLGPSIQESEEPLGEDNGKQGFIGFIKQGVKDFGGATNEIIRGGVKGLVDLGEMVSPLKANPYEQQIPKEEKDIKLKEGLKKILPSDESESTEKRERFGELGVTAAMGPGGVMGTLARTALAVEGGNLGEMIGGDTGKLVGEILPYVAPSPTKVIQAANANQKKLLDFGRKMGLSEEALAKVYKPESWWRNQLAVASTRRGKTAKSLKEAHKELGTVYDQLHHLPQANIALTNPQMVDFITDMGQALHTIDSQTVKLIMPEVIQMFKQQKVDGSEIMNLYHKINGLARQQPNTDAGKYIAGQLYKFNNTVRGQIGKISPELGTDFALANELYTNFSSLSSRLRPTLTSDIMSALKTVSALVSAAGGYLMPSYALAGIQAGRKFASQLLINPRLQNLTTKMVQAVSDNKIVIANSILQEFKKEVKEENPEIYELLKDESFSSAAPVVHKTEKKQSK